MTRMEDQGRVLMIPTRNTFELQSLVMHRPNRNHTKLLTQSGLVSRWQILQTIDKCPQNYLKNDNIIHTFIAGK